MKAAGKEDGRGSRNKAVISNDSDADGGAGDFNCAGSTIILKKFEKGGDAYEEIPDAAL